MDAIKKKMQAMKLEKDNAMDRADACEQQAKDANLRAERVCTYYLPPVYAHECKRHYFAQVLSTDQDKPTAYLHFATS